MVVVPYWARGIGSLGTETNSSRTHNVPIVCVPHSLFLAPRDHGPVNSFGGLRCGGQSEKRHRAALMCFIYQMGTLGNSLISSLITHGVLQTLPPAAPSPMVCYSPFPLQLHHP